MTRIFIFPAAFYIIFGIEHIHSVNWKPVRMIFI